jgi:hypothetical protein
MTAQTRTAYAKIERILGAEGLTFADVTHVVENVTVQGILDYDAAKSVRDAMFGAHRPSLTTVVVERLLRPAALIEIEVHASRGGGKSLINEPDAGWSRSAVREGHDGSVFLPTMLPVDAKGDVVAALPSFTRGALVLEFEGRSGLTPYAHWTSQWGLAPLWWLCIAIVLIFGAVSWRAAPRAL